MPMPHHGPVGHHVLMLTMVVIMVMVLIVIVIVIVVVIAMTVCVIVLAVLVRLVSRCSATSTGRAHVSFLPAP
jgi:Flp pilus assembly protein TadB